MSTTALEAPAHGAGVDEGQLPCHREDPELFFAESPSDVELAKSLCGTCPVRTECLAEALDNQIEWGVWGGMTERERRALLRRRPTASWRNVLETARVKAATEQQIISA